MGAEVSSGRHSSVLGAVTKASRRVRRTSVLKWQQRMPPAQMFGVIRHCERADGPFSFHNQGRWWYTKESRLWPMDPPLADAGVAEANKIASDVGEYAWECGSQVQVIITSPYFRCVQTALEIYLELNNAHGHDNIKILVDRSLGEIYGPAVMGPTEPSAPIRPFEQMFAYAHERGIHCDATVIGKWPAWPEDLGAGRRRFANRFLTYLHRSATTKLNFLIVTHADCIGTALSMMPSYEGRLIEKVDFGGMVLAKRHQCPKHITRRRRVDSVASSPIVPVGAPLVGIQRYRARALQALEDTLGEDDESKPTSANCSLELPKASDQWEVRISNITTRTAPADYFGAVHKKIRKAAKRSNFSKERIEELLGALPHGPMVTTEIELDTRHGQDIRVPSVLTNISMSTFIFGSSDVGNCSDIGDESRCMSEASIDIKSIQDRNESVSPDRMTGKAATISPRSTLEERLTPIIATCMEDFDMRDKARGEESMLWELDGAPAFASVHAPAPPTSKPASCMNHVELAPPPGPTGPFSGFIVPGPLVDGPFLGN